MEQSALAQGGRDTLIVESFKAIKLTKICLPFVIFNPQKFWIMLIKYSSCLYKHFSRYTSGLHFYKIHHVSWIIRLTLQVPFVPSIKFSSIGWYINISNCTTCQQTMFQKHRVLCEAMSVPFCLFYFMKKNECAGTSDFLRSRFHELNIVGTKIEITTCAQRGNTLTSIRCSLDLSQLTERSLSEGRNQN